MNVRRAIIATYVVQASAVVLIAATALLNWLADVSPLMFWMQLFCVEGALGASFIINGVLRRRLRLILRQQQFIASVQRGRSP